MGKAGENCKMTRGKLIMSNALLVLRILTPAGEKIKSATHSHPWLFCIVKTCGVRGLACVMLFSNLYFTDIPFFMYLAVLLPLHWVRVKALPQWGWCRHWEPT